MRSGWTKLLMTTIWMRAAHILWICAYLKAARSFDARKNLSNLLIKGWLPELNCLPRESAVRFTRMLLGGQFPSRLNVETPWAEQLAKWRIFMESAKKPF